MKASLLSIPSTSLLVPDTQKSQHERLSEPAWPGGTTEGKGGLGVAVGEAAVLQTSPHLQQLGPTHTQGPVARPPAGPHPAWLPFLPPPDLYP